MVEVPKPPWYHRFGVVFLAANLVGAAVLVVAVVALWPRAAAQRPGAPATTAGVGPQADQVVSGGPEPAAVLPTSTRARPAPGVLWQQGGAPGRSAGGSLPPGRWRVLWSFTKANVSRWTAQVVM